ncbi:type IV secretion system DNA-binding domain-containing protein [Candidatus Uhrbacteria bacterium]|nr:type IV secretion system DNA-binding domain-containing protein [Candidatus Uhrbacteria bacterium]
MPLALFQLFVIPETGIPEVDAAVRHPLFWVAVSALLWLIGFYVLFVMIRAFFRHRYQTGVGFKKVILLVTVPKESAEKGESGFQEKTLQEIQEDIAVAENVFASIGGLRAERGIKAWFFGREDSVSFEIVAKDGLVSFYIAAPGHLKDFIEQQVHAQYPLASIEETDDYNIFSPQGAIVGTLLGFNREHYFPIKTFKKMDSDPLNAITNALAKVDKKDGAAIQIIVRSAKREWRSPGVMLTREMQKGKSLLEAQRAHTFFGALGELFKSPPKKDGQPVKEYKMSQLEEEMVKGIEEKTGKLGLDVTVRIVASAPDAQKASMYLNNIVGAFAQYSSPQFGNALVRFGQGKSRLIEDFIFRHFADRLHTVMTGEELASLYHMPLTSTETPSIRWLMARKPPPPQNLPKEGIVLGFIKYRGEEHVVRMKQGDRRRHMYVIGKSGSGKSEFMKAMIKQDIEAGKGVCVIDPHGDLAEDCLAFVPRSRVDDVVYFNPADLERPVALNLMEYDPAYPEQKTFAVNEMLKIFDKLYDLKATGGPMFEQYMRNAMLLVMDHPESGSTLMEIPKVLSDEKFRAMKLSKCKTQVVRDFWTKEAQKAGGEASLANMVPYITSKLTPFISNDYMRPIIGQQESAINLRKIMDEGKILLLPLTKGKIGDLNAYLLGMVLVGKILMASLSRTDMDPKNRRDFYLYIDEFQNFLTDSISVILSEARKYGLNLTIAHQFIGQLTKGNDTVIRDAIFGNVGSMVSFRVGVEDAEFLEKEYRPVFSAFDLVNVEAYTANSKILIDNTASRPFNMSMYPPAKGNLELVDAVKQLSRLKFGRDRSIVEQEILERTQTPYAPPV